MFLIAANMLESCQEPALANSLLLVKKFLGFVQLIGPIVGMVGLTMHLIKLFVNPENKKHKSLITNWIIAILLLFFFPALINAVMYLLDDSFELSRCWNYAEEVSEGYGTGIDSDDEDDDKVPIIVNPSLDEIFDFAKLKKAYFVGDSRTCGMKNAVDSSDTNWVCDDSTGLKWLKNTAIPGIENNLGSGSTVIILMGVNDMNNVSEYVTYINSKAKEWKGDNISTYFISINPTNGDYDSLNSKINSFNSTVKANLSSNVTYIDTNSYLVRMDFDTSDGLHYSKATYKLLYKKIVEEVFGFDIGL